MYKEIISIKSVQEIEAILFKQADDYYFIQDEIKSSENKHIIKSLGARYLIKKSIIDFLGLNEGYHDIEIKNDPKGKPVVKVQGNIKEILLERDIQKIHVSISHSKQYISVLVILER